MGQKPITRLAGDLRPVYRQFQALLPRHPACASWDRLADSIGKVRRGTPTASVLQRELGAGRKGEPPSVHPDYLEAFRTVFGLDELGVGNAILLHPDPDARAEMIAEAFAQRAFTWIRRQKSETDGDSLALVPVAAAMGPGSGLYQALGTDPIATAPIGFHYCFKTSLVEDSYITILSQDPNEVVLDGRAYKPTHCLDGLLGCANRLIPAGEDLPLPGRVRMDEPLGLTQTVMVAAPQPLALPWDPSDLRQLEPTQLNRFMTGLLQRQPTAFRVATLDYHVVR
ncbi:hypothetical protein [Rhodospirillum sp. A1_3_36]|uniref:hypothetical protein n=1 Tax=Rhodospirillum sp. A1_3_36 TaxID=3391666 RepID=UPI0039A5239B